jgi:hypothetical protein
MALAPALDVGTVDPVTFEILSHRLHQITREMGATLERVGGTVNTTQMKDYMSARLPGERGHPLGRRDDGPARRMCECRRQADHRALRR